MQFGGTRNRISTPTAPEKGSFPLDHLGECKPMMIEYMKCLRKNNNITSKCRMESKHYLECRMDKELMAKEEMEHLGFFNNEKDEMEFWKSVDLAPPDRSKEKSGFVPGKKTN